MLTFRISGNNDITKLEEKLTCEGIEKYGRRKKWSTAGPKTDLSDGRQKEGGGRGAELREGEGERLSNTSTDKLNGRLVTFTA